MTLTKRLTLTLGALLLGGCGAMGGHHGHGMHGSKGGMPAHGLVALKSPYSPAETLARLEAEVTQRKLAVAMRIDHAAAAGSAGLSLRPTALMVFGNPQAGTPLMQCAQTVGIDLPMKALVWADESGQTWLGYNSPTWMMHRHGVRDCAPAEQVAKALAAVAAATVAK